jgi:hypothetical protein
MVHEIKNLFKYFRYYPLNGRITAYEMRAYFMYTLNPSREGYPGTAMQVAFSLSRTTSEALPNQIATLNPAVLNSNVPEVGRFLSYAVGDPQHNPHCEPA